MSRVATIRRVAEIAGVSTATVSRALAHPEKVSAETRARVLKAVAETGFVPNQQAVSFRRQATRNVILLVRDISNPFYLDIYRGVEEQAFAQGYSVLMGDAGTDDTRIRHYVDMVRNRHADGLILMTGRIPEALKAEKLPPIVVSLEEVEGVELPTIAIDNRAAGQLATAHLIGLGHRDIAHVTGPMGLVMARERHAGYAGALHAAGIYPDPALTIAGDFHFTSGQAAVRRLLASHRSFTAIFAANDEMAVGAINELRAQGIAVPREVSVVGFDDIVFAAASDPALTSVRQPRREIGAKSMDMLIEQLAARSFSTRTLAGVELVVRDSTAIAPAIKTRAGQTP